MTTTTTLTAIPTTPTPKTFSYSSIVPEIPTDSESEVDFSDTEEQDAISESVLPLNGVVSEEEVAALGADHPSYAGSASLVNVSENTTTQLIDENTSSLVSEHINITSYGALPQSNFKFIRRDKISSREEFHLFLNDAGKEGGVIIKWDTILPNETFPFNLPSTTDHINVNSSSGDYANYAADAPLEGLGTGEGQEDATGPSMNLYGRPSLSSPTGYAKPSPRDEALSPLIAGGLIGNYVF